MGVASAYGEVSPSFLHKGTEPFPWESRSSGEPAFDRSHGHDRRANWCVPDTWAKAWEASHRRDLCTASPLKERKTLITHRQHLITSTNLLNSTHTKWFNERRLPACGELSPTGSPEIS